MQGDGSVRMRDIAPEHVRELLDYNPITGVLTWKSRPWLTGRNVSWNTRYADKPITCLDKDGYIQIRIYKVGHRAHRVAWACHYGKWPQLALDHVNGIKADNRIDNLREATTAQNGHNVKICKRNSSGRRGVFWHRTAKKWQAGICFERREIYLGLHEDFDSAVRAREEAERRYYGKFARAA